MSLLINLRHLERKDVVLSGELSAAELDIESLDELIRTAKPLEYELTAQQLDDGILVRGWWRLELDCECGRCLKKFKTELEFDDWACHLVLEGDEAVAVKDDCVDLTPYLREDILLELPQRPLCQPDCDGLLQKPGDKPKQTTEIGRDGKKPSAWTELDKLKL